MHRHLIVRDKDESLKFDYNYKNRSFPWEFFYNLFVLLLLR